MTPSIEERELAIESLLELAECHEVNWPLLLITLGATDRQDAIDRICELADPTAWKNAVRDNERLLDRCRVLEAENTRLKAALAKGGEMSFGVRDEDWVEPDPEPIIKCRECPEWSECPCGCGYGICGQSGDYTREDDEC